MAIARSPEGPAGRRRRSGGVSSGRLRGGVPLRFLSATSLKNANICSNTALALDVKLAFMDKYKAQGDHNCP